MTQTASACATAAALALFALPAAAAPVNLNLWSTEGNGIWSTTTPDTVIQGYNPPLPTVFSSPLNMQGMRLTGTVTVLDPVQDNDDDYFGFVLGYDAPPGALQYDVFNPLADYILIDWKRTTELVEYAAGFSCVAQRGLSLSHVTGPLGGDAGGWCHSGPGIAELERGATLGATGWAKNTVYDYEITFTDAAIALWIDGVQQFDVAGTFENGSFGFYAHSLGDVRFTLDAVEPLTGPTPVPAPAAALLLPAALAGLAGLRRRRG